MVTSNCKSDEKSISNPSNKRARTCLSFEDRISNLPDKLIVEHILPLLITFDAIQTSVLSKRWHYLWAKVPHLDFVKYGGEFDHEVSDYLYSDVGVIEYKDEKEEEVEYKKKWGFACYCVKLYTGAMRLHQSRKLISFKLGFDYSQEHESFVSNSVRYAITRKVETLHLLFHGMPKLGFPSGNIDNESFSWELCMLPQHLYANTNSIVNIQFDCCHVSPRCTVSWSCMMNLYIHNTFISEDAIKKILMGSPRLTNVEFGDCKGFSAIDTCYSSSLRTLGVNGFSKGGPDMLNIYVSNHLETLILTGNFLFTKCRLMNTSSSLKKVELIFRAVPRQGEGDEDMYKEYGVILMELLAKLHGVSSLRVGNWCIKVLSMMKMKNVTSPYSYCNSLVLDTLLTDLELPGVISMLENSQHLKQLFVRSSKISNAQLQLVPYFNNTFNFGGRFDQSSSNQKLKQSLKNLKKVKILDSRTRRYNDECVSSFTCFLLSHTISPVKITIRKA
ncbi:hypothetical protein SOVF_011510 [Spinacia oleracea]|uniref:F-box protein At1g49610 n=1 Tax=Spinacia oleracea TaxID=3562 RepID=A0A9R0K5H2_SPIOL|nr:putative F-box protein At1g49610 [Spinacia oleracea]KNA24890.1 hypothetical protein SOVF_011510 [Spinacia oleracea]